MALFFKGKKAGDACKPLPTLDAEQTERYRRFRRLLEHNRTGLTLQADLEQIYFDNRPFIPQMVEKKIHQLLLEVDGMVHALSGMTGRDYRPLYTLLAEIERNVEEAWTGFDRRTTDRLVIPFDRIQETHAGAVGAKAANLAQIARELHLPTPSGFAITTASYWLFLKETGLAAEFDTILAELADDDPLRLAAVSRQIHGRIMATELPATIREAMESAARIFQPEQRLAVRSSAIGEDGEISFAGQYTSVLGVLPADLDQAYRQVVASKFSAPALSYRMHHGLDDRETPMGVLVLTMIQPRTSGVVYTADPTGKDRDSIRVSAVSGLGEGLVGGNSSPEQMFRIDKRTRFLIEAKSSGPHPIPAPGFLDQLAQHAIRMEQHFQCPLDIEWAVDGSGHLFILQVRPLLVLAEEARDRPETILEYPGHPLLLQGGRCAASGVVSGRAWVEPLPSAGETSLPLDPDTILVARTASTSLTPWISKVKGIITDVGGVASHLASVAREFGVPALFDTRIATSTLKTGDEITLWASQARVYQGVVSPLLQGARQVKRPIFNSPAHQRLQHLLDLISPLNLTDPNSPDFSPEKCRTVHDIIRYGHEEGVRQMFNFGESIGHTQAAVRLKVNIPLILFALDLGGGLRPGLTTCHEINAHDVASTPFNALWRGFSHPGINWTSAVAVGAQDFMSLMAAGARPQLDDQLGRASYAILSGDYMNLSVRFGYHFATVDALCGPDMELNYITLNFAGGAGGYHGRSLRIQFLANVLTRLGFATAIKGDMIEASLLHLEQSRMDETLDQLGRLLAASRLLDMALKIPQQVHTLTESFFQGKYDFLEPEREDAPAAFYLITGDWKNDPSEGEFTILQDGSHFTSTLSITISHTMTRLLGKRYQEFLDNIEAYCYFPLLIAKESHMGDGSAQVWVKPLAGTIDQASGLAFGIRDWANYFVFRINALENNGVLYEFKNGKRIERQGVKIPVLLAQWHKLGVRTEGRRIRAYLNDQQLMEYVAERDLSGFVGLWAKADSVSLFRELTMCPRDGQTRSLR